MLFSGLKIPYEKSAKQENSSLFMIFEYHYVEHKNEGVKTRQKTQV
jgi:hypothetical protein